MTALPPELLAPSPGSEEGIAEIVASEDLLPERVQSWRIDGTGSAAWAMAHYAEAEAAIKALEAQAVEWYARIDEWLSHEAMPYQRTLAYFEGQLQRYALDLREADPKRKSVVLPSGKVQTTSRGAKVVIEDEAAVIAWAAKHAPTVVKLTPKVGLTELREVVQARRLVTQAWVTNSCGCKVSVRDDEGIDLPEIGDETFCSECSAEALVGQIEPLAFRWLATTEDGEHVPGVDVEEPTVTAKVVVG